MTLQSGNVNYYRRQKRILQAKPTCEGAATALSSIETVCPASSHGPSTEKVAESFPAVMELPFPGESIESVGAIVSLRLLKKQPHDFV